MLGGPAVCTGDAEEDGKLRVRVYVACWIGAEVERNGEWGGEIISVGDAYEVVM